MIEDSKLHEEILIPSISVIISPALIPIKEAGFSSIVFPIIGLSLISIYPSIYVTNENKIKAKIKLNMTPPEVNQTFSIALFDIYSSSLPS